MTYEVPNASLADAKSATRKRDVSVDATRGFAVFTMFIWHTADAWIAPLYRTAPWFGRAPTQRLPPTLFNGLAFDWVQTFGGTAAPSFFLLAGVSIALGQSFRPERFWGSQARFAHVMVIGFLLKLFSYAIDRQGILRPSEYAHLLPWAATLLMLEYAFRTGQRRWLFVLATVTGLWTLATQTPTYTLFLQRYGRLDVLQHMGLALLITNAALRCLHHISARAQMAFGAALAVVLAILAYPAHTYPRSWARPAMDWVVRHTGESYPYFPLLPWICYALVGAALGAWLRQRTANAASQNQETPRWPLMLIGLLLCAVFLERSPIFIALANPYFWHVSRLCFYVGFLLLGLGWLGWLSDRNDRASTRATQLLVTLGQHSLFAYGVHLEFVFGLLGKPFTRALTPPQFALAALALTLGMYALVTFWSRRGKIR